MNGPINGPMNELMNGPCSRYCRLEWPIWNLTDISAFIRAIRGQCL
ncbi:hypothetical protein [Paenibacillus sp. N3.4]|nr:hypothetical protein [Paenibacillus sp. N3.4]